MNSRSKGNKNERRAELLLKKLGYETQRAGYRRFKQNDFFGLFDILAIKPNENMLVQVKSNAKPVKKTFEDILAFANKYPQYTVNLWVWRDRRGWRRWVVIGGEWLEAI